MVIDWDANQIQSQTVNVLCVRFSEITFEKSIPETLSQFSFVKLFLYSVFSEQADNKNMTWRINSSKKFVRLIIV